MVNVVSAQIPFHFGDWQKHDFDSFLPGENQKLMALLMLIAKNEVRHRLYLWGAKSVGKTHLLQATCRQANEYGLRAAYIPLKQHAKISVDILHDLGEMDLIGVDDLETIRGAIEWQQGLIWLYNELRDQSRSLLFGATVSPQNIMLELADLTSRLAWDQVFQVKEANEAVKIQILKQKAKRRSLELSDEVIDYLIRRVKRDLNSLINLLDAIDHASLTAKRRVTIPFIKEFISMDDG